MTFVNDLEGGSLRFRPVAVVDIGSNSVRLVVYDGLRRAPTPVVNEKILCGLGRGVSLTGNLPADAIERALAALRRFRALAKQIGVLEVFAVATAAGGAACSTAWKTGGKRRRLSSRPRPSIGNLPPSSAIGRNTARPCRESSTTWATSSAKPISPRKRRRPTPRPWRFGSSSPPNFPTGRFSAAPWR